MKKRYLAAFMAAVLAASALTGCGSKTETASVQEGDAAQSSSAETAKETKDPADMPEYKTVYATEITTLNYMESNTTDVMTLAGNTIDGLFEFDCYGQLQPCIAESYEVSDDQLVYTVKMREDVMWYTWEGEEVRNVKAEDFVSAAKWILTQENASGNSKNLYDVLKNGKKFYDGEIEDFAEVGVAAVDEYTIEYTLEQPIPWFLS